ncbi:MAG: ABC transporter ATP-binding protein [Bdellovibrionales bacterium]
MENDNASNAAPPQRNSLNLLKRIVKNYVFPYKGLLIIALICSAIVAATTAGIAQMMQPILDDVINGQDESMIIPVATVFLLAFCIRGAASYASVIFMNKVSQFMIGDIQKHVFSHFLSLDLAFFHNNPSARLMSLIVNDVNVLRSTISDMLMGVGRSFLTLILLIGVMFYQEATLASAAMIVFPFAAIFVAYLGKKIRQISKTLQGDVAHLSDKLAKVFQGIRVVKAYGMEAHEKERANTSIMAVRKMNLKAVRVGQLSTPVNEVLVGLILFGVIIYGGYQAADGEMTAGQLGAFLTAFIMAYEPMKKLARLNNAIQMGLGAAERIFSVLDLNADIQSKDSAQELQSPNSDIIFKDAKFQYESAEDVAVRSLSFTAPKGNVTALVGPSGGGKTTILNLIPRFYDLHDGQICIGDQDIRDVTIQSLRRNIALVSQDITIFDASVGENIAYGKIDATQEEIEAAAKAAAAHAFITEMEHGYDTQVGEDGVKLSGGQRQRISIARAILRDAPILLLDEATSALDNESEKAVQKALKALEKGRTTIVIAHRLSTIQDADQILVINNGEITDKGTHDELLASSELYQKMHKAGTNG